MNLTVLQAARPRPGRTAAPPGRFERAVLPCLAPVYSAALCLAGDPAEAEDLVLETFARACLAFPRRQPGTGSLETWLYRILAGVRRERRRPEQARDDTPAAAGPGPADAEALRLLPGSEVRRALRELPEDLRFAVHLADVTGLSCGQIASITGTPAGTVRTRLRDGRRQLRRRLQASAAGTGASPRRPGD